MPIGHVLNPVVEGQSWRTPQITGPSPQGCISAEMLNRIVISLQTFEGNVCYTCYAHWRKATNQRQNPNPTYLTDQYEAIPKKIWILHFLDIAACSNF